MRSSDGLWLRSWFGSLWLRLDQLRRRDNRLAHRDFAAEARAILHDQSRHSDVAFQRACEPDYEPVARRHRSGNAAALVDLDAAGDFQLTLHRADNTEVAIDVQVAADQPVTRTKYD